MNITKQDLLNAVATASAGYFAGNPVSEDRIEAIVQTFFRVLASGSGSNLLAVQRAPMVPVEEAIKDDEITCLECNRAFRSLTIHLRRTHHMTPDEYRVRWGLPDDYPMLAPNASVARSELSKAHIRSLRETGRRVGRPPKDI